MTDDKRDRLLLKVALQQLHIGRVVVGLAACANSGNVSITDKTIADLINQNCDLEMCISRLPFRDR